MLAAADGARLRRRRFAGIKVAKTAFLSTRAVNTRPRRRNADTTQTEVSMALLLGGGWEWGV